MSQTTDAIKRLDDGGEHHDVVVVGGGQAGLAIGHFLAQQGSRLHDPRSGRGASGCVARSAGTR